MKNTRRYDIDWIRVLVFDLLILFHVGMFFNTWGWHIKNNEIVEWLFYPMYFSSQWRIPILFVVSGIGTYFALGFRSGKQYIKERFTRLFIPLLVGIMLTVSPQVYFERLADGSFGGSFWSFFPQFFQGVYPDGNFSWHHLWFLPYLLTLSIVATPFFLWLRKENNPLIDLLTKWLEKTPWSLYLFAVPFIFTKVILKPYHPVSHAFWGDWYALSFYFFLFVAGFMLIRLRDHFWNSVIKLRWITLTIGVVTYVLMIWGRNLEIRDIWVPALLESINTWSWILAIFGFAAQFLNKESKLVKYRNEAVYPFYIFHQVITVAIGFYLMNETMPVFWKFLIMVVGTFGGSWILTEIVKRIRVLRPLFGLKNR